MGNTLLALIVGAFVGLIAFLIAAALPFTAPYAQIIGLIAAALAFWQSYVNNWPNTKRPLL